MTTNSSSIDPLSNEGAAQRMVDLLRLMHIAVVVRSAFSEANAAHRAKAEAEVEAEDRAAGID